MTTHFIDIAALTTQTAINLINLAYALKHAPRPDDQVRLKNKSVGLLFKKPSTRTRVSFEVGISQLGGNAVTLHDHEVGLGQREPIQDVARVISRYMDMVMIRTFDHSEITQFASFSTIPVINGLTDWSHPCQALADFLTIKEYFGTFQNLKVVYLGDGNNVCRSLVELGHLLGVQVVVSAPKSNGLDSQMPHITNPNPIDAVRGAHVIYTDTWVSMGEEGKKNIHHFQPYQVNAQLMQHADPNAIILHCLPAHRGEEITDDMIESSQSKVFDQAENRLHAQKAIMTYLLEGH